VWLSEAETFLSLVGWVWQCQGEVWLSEAETFLSLVGCGNVSVRCG
jgi:hypothetical protein